jgi:hypothetical protein
MHPVVSGGKGAKGNPQLASTKRDNKPIQDNCHIDL